MIFWLGEWVKMTEAYCDPLSLPKAAALFEK
jgi:hypothetical protein